MDFRFDGPSGKVATRPGIVIYENGTTFLSGPVPLDRMVVLFCFVSKKASPILPDQKGMLFPKRPITFTSLLVTCTLNYLGLKY